MFKKKKLLKISSLFVMLFSLTGCYNHYYVKDINTDKLSSIFTQVCLRTIQPLNELYFKAYSGILKTTSGGIGKTLDYLNALGPVIKSIITIVNVLGIGSLLVFFAVSLFKNNMSEQNREMAPDMFTNFKKFIVAIVLLNLIPTICISSFVGSSVIASSAVKSFASADYKDDWESIYTRMSENKISYSTYCQGAQTEYDLSANGDSSTLVFLSTDHPLYQEFCTDNGVEYPNVYTASFAPGRKYQEFTPFVLEADDETTLSGIVISFITTMICGFLYTFSVAKLAVELIVLIATSWWYVGKSIADVGRESSLGDFSKKLLTICLTQFFMTFELGFYEVAVLSLKAGITTQIVLNIAMALVLASTPSAVAELTQSTGTTGQATSFVKGVSKRHGLIK